MSTFKMPKVPKGIKILDPIYFSHFSSLQTFPSLNFGFDLTFELWHFSF